MGQQTQSLYGYHRKLGSGTKNDSSSSGRALYLHASEFMHVISVCEQMNISMHVWLPADVMSVETVESNSA